MFNNRKRSVKQYELIVCLYLFVLFMVLVSIFAAADFYSAINYVNKNSAAVNIDYLFSENKQLILILSVCFLFIIKICDKSFAGAIIIPVLLISIYILLSLIFCFFNDFYIFESRPFLKLFFILTYIFMYIFLSKAFLNSLNILLYKLFKTDIGLYEQNDGGRNRLNVFVFLLLFIFIFLTVVFY